MPHIYLGTGGYSDTDLLGTLYPPNTPKADFLSHYARHYDSVEINSTFHAPIGTQALKGMLAKAAGKLRFSLKLHQDFSHTRLARAEQAVQFLASIQPMVTENCLAALFLQFPAQFERTPTHRRYLGELTRWFEGYPLAVEFRHPSWHNDTVWQAFEQHPHLIWCNVDYPANIGLPAFSFHPNQRRAYLRLHGHNSNWWKAQSAAERHNYRYTEAELVQLADRLFAAREQFDELYCYFQNTTESHSFYNLARFKSLLAERGFGLKTAVDPIPHEQGSLF